MPRPISLGIFMVGLLAVWPASVGAQQKALHGELKSGDLTQALLGKKVETMLNGAWEYSFDSGEDISLRGAQGTKGEGRWWPVKGGGLKAKLTLSGGPCMDGDDCSGTWPHELTWYDVRVSGSGLVRYYEQACKKGDASLYDCTIEDACMPSCAALVKIVPGHRDRTVYDGVVSTFLAKAGDDFLGVAGRPAKNPRDDSEIWWVEDPCAARSESEQHAKKLAALLADTIGKVDPQKWTFGAQPYDVIVVAGRDAPGMPPRFPSLRVKVLNGGCPSKAACENPRYEAIKQAVKDSGSKLVASGVAKKKRAATEVWFQASAEDTVEVFLAAQLSELSSIEPKPWEWGGDFDVLIVVAQPE